LYFIRGAHLSQDERVDPEAFQMMIDNLPPAELERLNNLQHQAALDEYERFKVAYEKDQCYLCGKPFKTISQDFPCIHWLLRSCKFKAKDFPKVYQSFDYHQISSYLRWVANQERFQGNINDLAEEKSDKKLFQVTIKWKNIDWTFDCTISDFKGHGGSNSDFPHYHFQMRIDGNQFINFNQHHIPFSAKDLFKIDLLQEKPDLVIHNFGPGGSGMQDAVDVNPMDILENIILCENEDDATYHLHTLVMAGDDPISGDDIQAMIDESRETGKPLAALVEKHLAGTNARVFIAPAESIPDIAKRTEHKR
jgi:hypothetical protein